MSKFKHGDIVYWCKNLGNGNYEVAWGRVDEEYYDKVSIDYLELKENRRVNGIPIDEFKDERYHKLPKGWTYNTKLYDLTWDEQPEELKDLSIMNPDDVKFAYEKGWLVKSSTKFHGNVEAEITKEGYRIVLKYPMWEHHIDYTGVERHRLYRTYKEAADEVYKERAEFERQASLSDEEWSKEQIQHSIDRYCVLFGETKDSDIVKRISDYLFGLNNIVDIETRVNSSGIQWKYWKKKKWMNVDVA